MKKKPIDTKELTNYLPHRPPMVWIDRVLEYSQDSGVCEVIPKSNSLYIDNNKIMETSALEWMAQSYGFIKDAFLIDQDNVLPPKKTLFGGVNNAEFFEPLSLDVKSYLVYIHNIKIRGPLNTCTSEIKDKNGKLYCRASIKIFAQ